MKRYYIEELWCDKINKKVYFEFYVKTVDGEHADQPTYRFIIDALKTVRKDL